MGTPLRGELAGTAELGCQRALKTEISSPPPPDPLGASGEGPKSAREPRRDRGRLLRSAGKTLRPVPLPPARAAQRSPAM